MQFHSQYTLALVLHGLRKSIYLTFPDIELLERKLDLLPPLFLHETIRVEDLECCNEAKAGDYGIGDDAWVWVYLHLSDEEFFVFSTSCKGLLDLLCRQLRSMHTAPNLTFGKGERDCMPTGVVRPSFCLKKITFLFK